MHGSHTAGNVHFEGIPPELTECNQWVLWRTITRDDRETKCPFTVYGTPASSTDPAAWSSFDNVVSTFDETQYSGIGFVFTSNDNFVGIDLDGCRDPETGTIADWAVDEVQRFSSYTEISPSGTGLKIWITADTQISKGRKRQLSVPEIVAKAPAVEVYTQGRFFAVTGAVHRNYTAVHHREQELQEFLQQHWPAAPATAGPAPDWRSDDAVVERARRYVARIPGAVSGSGGHNATFHVACVLRKGFELSEDQAFDVLAEWNATCEPPWSEHELRHKVQSAGKATGESGYLRHAKPERWNSIPIPQWASGDRREADKPPIDFGIINSRVFAESDFRVDYLIDGVMAAGQPQLYGGPSKSLKTSTLVDQCLSLAAGVPFLGKFNVPNPHRVLLLSSESGTATLQETAFRICQSKGIELAELEDSLHWGFRPPMLTEGEHIESLQGFIERHSISVLAVDPAYLSMNLVGNEAANQFAVGAVLMNLTRLAADTGVTPVLASHFRMHMQPGVLPGLDHIAGAGFGQWARQWLLLNRAVEYDPDTPGHHEVLMVFGGSAGHCGAWGMTVEEGRQDEGRFWSVELNTLSQVRENKEQAREDRKRDQEHRTRENHRAAILRALRQCPAGESKTRIRELAGLSSRYFEPVFQDMLSAMEIEPCEFSRGDTRKDGSPRTYLGFRQVDPASRLQSDTRTLSDTAGHCPTVSGRT